MEPTPTSELPDPAQSAFRRAARLRAFWPAPLAVDARERRRAAIGALVGILLTAVLSHWLAVAAGTSLPWLVAPMGASAVLVFCLPASPLAQPWSVVGGNLLSAVVGVACARWLPDPVLAAGVAVAAAIALMFATRSLHPPGGAMALLAVLAGWQRFDAVLFPVLVNGVLLVGAGIVYNGLTGRAYPHAQRAAGAPAPRARFSTADLDAALAHYNQVLDIPRDALEDLLVAAERAAYRRNFGELLCADIMARNPWAVEFGTPLAEAWALMRSHRIKALPVVDRARRLVGIVTLADFMRHAEVDADLRLADRLRRLVKPTGLSHTDKPEVVGQIMTRHVRVTSANRPLVDLVPVFSEGNHHHLPVIDGQQKLVGIITQADLVRALHRAVRGPGEGIG